MSGPYTFRPKRWLVVVNIALIPYVACRFPHELRGYVRGCWRVLIGKQASG